MWVAGGETSLGLTYKMCLEVLLAKQMDSCGRYSSGVVELQDFLPAKPLGTYLRPKLASCHSSFLFFSLQGLRNLFPNDSILHCFTDFR